MPREEASSAIPAPVTPPPITIRSNFSFCARAIWRCLSKTEKRKGLSSCVASIWLVVLFVRATAFFQPVYFLFRSYSVIVGLKMEST